MEDEVVEPVVEPVEEIKERNVPPPPDPSVKVWTKEEIEAYIAANGVYPNLSYNEDPGEETKSRKGILAKARKAKVLKARKMRAIARTQAKYGMSVTAASRLAGYAGSNIKKLITTHPAYIEERTRLMKALDARDTKLMQHVAKVMAKGLSAKKKVVVKNGVFEKTEDVPDMSERRKSAELIARVTKQLSDPKDESGDTPPVNFNVLINMVKEAERERGLGE